MKRVIVISLLVLFVFLSNNNAIIASSGTEHHDFIGVWFPVSNYDVSHAQDYYINIYMVSQIHHLAQPMGNTPSLH